MSGFMFDMPDGTGHAATPKRGTYTRERDGEPASLLDTADYPIAARCLVCDGRVRLAGVAQARWAHTPAPAASGEAS